MNRRLRFLPIESAYALFDLRKLLLIGAACTDSCVLAKIVGYVTLTAPEEHEILWPT